MIFGALSFGADLCVLSLCSRNQLCFCFSHMSSGDCRADVSQEHVSQLQADNATQRAHIQLLTERLTGSEARGEHASDLRLHAADLRAQVEATKAAADSALHELRLQHTREAELLQRVVEGMQAQLRDKDQMVAMLVRQLADKDKQLPALLQAAVGDIQAEVTALRATLAEKEKIVSDMQAELRAEKDAAVVAISEKESQVAALTAAVAERDRTIAAHASGGSVGPPRAALALGPVANSVVSAENFHGGARVKLRHGPMNAFSPSRGVIHALAGEAVTGRWDGGLVLSIRVPDPLFTYE
jgi:septal ring factor EnvC (AmiA/AmiB activator)